MSREGTGTFILSDFFGFIFIVYAVLLCAVLCVFSFVYTSTDIQHIKRQKQVPYLGYVRGTCKRA